MRHGCPRHHAAQGLTLLGFAVPRHQGPFSLSIASGMETSSPPAASARPSGHVHSRSSLPLGLHNHHHHHHPHQHFSDKQHHHSSSSTVPPFCFHHGASSGGGGATGASAAGNGGGLGMTASSTVDNNACRLIEYRNAQVAAFQVSYREFTYTLLT